MFEVLVDLQHAAAAAAAAAAASEPQQVCAYSRMLPLTANSLYIFQDNCEFLSVSGGGGGY